MGLTLIQEHVLEALAREARWFPDHAVKPPAVRERLRDRRPRPVSEAYVRRILRELVNRRVDGDRGESSWPVVQEYRLRRGAIAYTVTYHGIRYVQRRQRAQHGLEEDRRRYDEIPVAEAQELVDVGWVRSLDGLWRHAEILEPLPQEAALARVRREARES